MMLVTKMHFALIASAAILATVDVGSAQTPPAPPPPVVKESDPNKTLSDKLSETEGVLTPRSDADKGMQIKPPPSTGAMPVIPPPGEPGGDQSQQPK